MTTTKATPSPAAAEPAVEAVVVDAPVTVPQVVVPAAAQPRILTRAAVPVAPQQAPVLQDEVPPAQPFTEEPPAAEVPANGGMEAEGGQVTVPAQEQAPAGFPPRPLQMLGLVAEP